MSIRSGTCPSDRLFDRFLPYDLRRVSRQHWTPLVVALRVAEWLDLIGVRQVVDLGSGAGKFCVQAFDQDGARSKKVCARLRITR